MVICFKPFPLDQNVQPGHIIRFLVAKQSVNAAKVEPYDIGFFCYYSVKSASAYYARIAVTDVYHNRYEVRCFEIEVLM